MIADPLNCLGNADTPAGLSTIGDLVEPVQVAVRSLLNQQIVLDGLVRGQDDGAGRLADLETEIMKT